jgi:hypothetical protein
MSFNYDIENNKIQNKLSIFPVNRFAKDKIIAELKFLCILYFEKKFDSAKWKGYHNYKKFLRYINRNYSLKIKVSRIPFKIYFESIPINFAIIWNTIEKEFIKNL